MKSREGLQLLAQAEDGLYPEGDKIWYGTIESCSMPYGKRPAHENCCDLPTAHLLQ